MALIVNKFAYFFYPVRELTIGIFCHYLGVYTMVDALGGKESKIVWAHWRHVDFMYRSGHGHFDPEQRW